MTPVSKQIALPLALNCYENLKKFLDSIKQVFPEETKTENGQLNSNYSFGVKLNQWALPVSYAGSREILNFSYGKDNINLDSVSIHTMKADGILVLVYSSITPNNIFINGPNVEIVENCEKEILRLFQQSTCNQCQEPQVSNDKAVFLEKKYDFADSCSFISDEKSAIVIKDRIVEIEAAVDKNMPLAAIFLIGSTLEGVLAAIANKYQEQFNTAKAAPKKDGKPLPLSSWVLGSLIDVAHEVKVLDKDVVDFAKCIRNYRNYIHPREQVKQNFSPTMVTVEISLQVLKAALSQINAFDKLHDRRMYKE